MEGFFPICQYCEITGVKKNTAHRRAERGSVEAFKNKEGRWFLYFCDDKEIAPEGYVKFKDYADSHGISESTLHNYVQQGRISKDNILTVKKVLTSAIIKGSKKRIYIKKDAPLQRKDRKECSLLILRILKPSDDYLTVDEWSKRENIKNYTSYYWIKYGYLKYTNVEKHYYIPKTETIDTVFQRKTEKWRKHNL